MNTQSPIDVYDPTPEQNLVVALLSQRREMDATQLAALVRKCDWKRLLGNTVLSLYPFLCYALTEAGMLEFVPTEALAVLEQAKTEAVIRYMRRKTELQKVFSLFKENQIEAVVLKGASLGELVYPMPYLRPMRDVDLWIPDAQMGCARSLLEANGYQEKDVRSLECDARSGREIRLAKLFKYDLMVIELHATLDVHLPGEQEEVDTIWARRIEQPALGIETLHPQDMLYHLCTHLSLRHRFEQGLLWLLDIGLFMKKYGEQMDWDRMAEDCRRQHTSKYIYLTLAMVDDLLGCSVAKDAFKKLDAPNDLPGVKALAWRQIWYSDFNVLPPRRLLMLVTIKSPGKIFTFLVDRVRKYLTSQSPDKRQPESLTHKVSSASQWIKGDLRKGYAAFQRGAFSPPNFRRAYELEVRRTEFEKEMQV